MAQTMSIKETRDKLADVINQVSIAGEVIVVTKFGQPKAMIVPIKEKIEDKSGIKESFGKWYNRNDSKNSAEWVEVLRSNMSER